MSCDKLMYSCFECIHTEREKKLIHKNPTFEMHREIHGRRSRWRDAVEFIGNSQEGHFSGTANHDFTSFFKLAEGRLDIKCAFLS